MIALSPYDDPVPHGWRVVRASLRISVALMCWGLAVHGLSDGAESPAVSLLLSRGWLPEDRAAQCLQWASYAMIACGIFTLMRPCWFVLVPVVAWTGAGAAAAAVLGEDPIRTLDQSVLVIAPLSLLLIDFWPPLLRFSLGRTRFSLGLLRVAAAASLFAQAALFVREIGGSTAFAGMLEAAIHQFTPIELDEPRMSQLLAALAAVNVAFGLVLLTARQRHVVFFAALWSVALAAIPVVAEGLPGVPRLMTDTPRAGAALAICLFWMLAVKEQQPTIVPAM
jgi:hypothetical protein